tara:strand:+ start:187 stop:657 length:471 start_codon:yes stop_codon:yes gene_type:complete
MTDKKQPEQQDDLTELDNLKEPEEQPEPGDYDPGADDAAQQQLAAAADAAQQQAAASAMVTVSVIEAALSMMYPGVQIAPVQKQAIIQKLAPVLMKYNAGGMPPWMAAYKEELELAGAVGLAGFAVWQQIKAMKAKEVKEAAEGAVDGKEPEPKAA